MDSKPMTDTEHLRGLIERLNCLHVWPQSVADHHADVLTPRQIEQLYAVGAVATEAANALDAARKEIERLQDLIYRAQQCVPPLYVNWHYTARAELEKETP